MCQLRKKYIDKNYLQTAFLIMDKTLNFYILKIKKKNAIVPKS